MSVLNAAAKAIGFVSGGASGLGAATVKRLVQHGARVTVFDLPSSTEKFNKLASELDEDLRHNCLFTPGDVTDEQSIKNALLATQEKFGPVNLNVNCAGIGYAQRIHSSRSNKLHSQEEFERVLDINVGGTFRVLARCVEMMATVEMEDPRAERGVIINTSSVAAFEGQIGQVAYAASKGAIASLSLPAARDLSSLGIRVMTIAPGIIETPLLRNLPEKAVEHLISETVFPKRLGQPEEFAHLVQCIYENTLMNGTTIRLDGAMRMPP